jgi:DNA-binding XRE family transcriptional regulator
MDKAEFYNLRKRLKKTQLELARLLGTSIKAVHSYEQGWRLVPAHVERQLLYLVAMARTKMGERPPCWAAKDCPAERRARCPAWEFQAGDLCWFINGTHCEGFARRSWKEKMAVCGSCEVFRSQFRGEEI